MGREAVPTRRSAKALQKGGAEMLTIKFDETTCREGCGQTVSKGKSFKQGHDARLRSNLYKASRADEQVTVNGKKLTASAAIKQFGFPEPAVRKPRVRKPKAESKAPAKKATAKKAPAKPKLASVG